MSVESERQKRVLGILCDAGGQSTVEIARQVRFSLKKTAGAATMLMLRGYVERSTEGVYSATSAGIAFHASGDPMRSGPVRPRGLMDVSRDTLRQRAWTGMRLHGRFKCLDGNRLDTSPSNWEPIPRGVLARLNGGRHKKRIAYDTAPAELKPTVMAVAKLEHRTGTLRRKSTP